MGNFGLHVIEHDRGFSFVGSVPGELLWVSKAGYPLTDEEIEGQLRLPSRYRGMKTRSFASRDEAWREAARLGYAKEGK